ncbi:Ig-like domain-containing protein [Qipengyuania gelatinilytica]|uniref:Cadherin domain-containing protein n=1 Tax=Qipengyuania gelatinilytica TaxID=2867231 RepID=A0ABX9A347_9SPHN|nr:hypothetical protein [Qipengyuania gelatinilytica]QZD94333.1 hypothetical protein K3136_09525 [Qipengyuania gelatinilytica]
MAFLIAGCGGDDGPSAGSSQNIAPRFSSPASATVDENNAGTFYTAAASDSDGDALDFSIAGGADAQSFQLTASGQLSFVDAPNFEDPGDSDGDNVYSVTLAVSDGRASSTLELAVTVSNLADGVNLERVATNLVDAVHIMGEEDSTSLYLGTEDGQIFAFDTVNETTSDIGNIFENDIDRGNARAAGLGIFPSDEGGLIAYVIETAFFDGMHHVITRTIRANLVGEWSGGNAISGTVISEEQAPQIGGLVLGGGDSSVLFFIDDGGEPSRAQEEGMLGNVVRVTPRTAPCPGAACGPFIFARTGIGTHKPVGATRVGDQIFFLDQGDTRYDEINRFDIDETAINFGWFYREGRAEVQAGGVGPFRDPVLAYDRNGTTHGNFAAITYTGTAVPNRAEQFLTVTSDGRFFQVDPADLESQDVSGNSELSEIVGEFQTDIGTLENVKGMAIANGMLFVLDGDGELYRAVSEQL